MAVDPSSRDQIQDLAMLVNTLPLSFISGLGKLYFGGKEWSWRQSLTVQCSWPQAGDSGQPSVGCDDRLVLPSRPRVAFLKDSTRFLLLSRYPLCSLECDAELTPVSSSVDRIYYSTN